MAEVTKPIALDESFNTTEATPRNIADVLADALGSGNTLSGLNDVIINSVTLSNNQTLMYDSVAGKWVNADGVRTWQGTQAEYNAIPSPDPAVTYYITDSTSVSIGLDDLTNVSTVGVSDGEFLYYDNGTWKNIDLTAEDIPLSSIDQTPTSEAIGDLSALTTTDKSSVVGAVNEVVSTKATTGSAITFAPETGITATATSAVINKTVLLNLTFSGSFTLNTWKKIGTMNVTPSISTIYVAGIHSSDGLYAGMIQIRSDKGIYFYPKVEISGTVGCTANFNIT